MKLRGLEEGQMIFQICNQFLLISRSKEDLFTLHKLYDRFAPDLESELLARDSWYLKIW